MPIRKQRPLSFVGAVFCAAGYAGGAVAATTTDAIVVGSGIAGLSAAFELAKGGAAVTMIDMASVFGGHAVMATGDLCLIGTPFQTANGVKDTPDLAYKDFMTWGEDPNPQWVRTYVDHSRDQIYDWLISMGVTFEKLILPPGNSVPRVHRAQGRGVGLVSPIFKEVARRPNVTFKWNTRLDRLIIEDRRVVGVATTNLRTGLNFELRARVVVLATGGFQSNLEKVRASWPPNAPFPERLLVGAGVNALGTGHDVAQAAGAALTRLDHQWNYITGLPDPRFPGTARGLNAYNLKEPSLAPRCLRVGSRAGRLCEKSASKPPPRWRRRRKYLSRRQSSHRAAWVAINCPRLSQEKGQGIGTSKKFTPW